MHQFLTIPSVSSFINVRDVRITYSCHSSSSPAGIFATAMIILPSVCSGSQIVLSHSSTTKAIASPPEPMTSTTILAVKQFLGSISRKWDAGRYKTAPEGGFVVYPLQHKYDTSGLLNGGNVLKDANERRVALLEEAAGLQGFVVVLANLEHYVTGTTDTHTDPYEGYSYVNPYPHKHIRDSSGSYRDRSRFGSHCKHDSDIDSGDELDTLQCTALGFQIWMRCLRGRLDSQTLST